jgi:hypothetical protein
MNSTPPPSTATTRPLPQRHGQTADLAQVPQPVRRQQARDHVPLILQVSSEEIDEGLSRGPQVLRRPFG